MQTEQHHQQLFQQWQFARYTEKQIVNELQAKGYVLEETEKLLSLYQKHRNAVRSQKGMVLIVLGAILGFASCVLTLLDVMPAMRDLILVGLTTIAICIAVCGCYYVFE